MELRYMNYVLSIFMALFCHPSTCNISLTILTEECPTNCSCDTSFYTLTCDFKPDLSESRELKNYLSTHHVQTFSVHNSLADLQMLGSLGSESVKVLNVSFNSIAYLSRDCISAYGSIRVLDLSHNFIDTISESSFHLQNSVNYIKELNISFNLLNNIPVFTFHELRNLERLDLSQNRIEEILGDLFQDLTNLQVLDISFNKLSFLSSQHIATLSNLRELNLRNNLFTTFHSDVIPNLKHIPYLDISFNPYQCSCAVQSLIDHLRESTDTLTSNTTILNVEDITCISPEVFQGRLLLDVDTNSLNCTHPEIVNISSEQDVQYLRDLYLSCTVIGYPDPAITWYTPWGDIFTHHTSKHLIGDTAINHSSKNLYTGKSIHNSSQITVTPDGTLHVKNFRGYFAGNYTCFAFTPFGNVSSTVQVRIFSPFPKLYLISCIYGGISAGGFALFGAIMAIIITIIRRLCCPDFFMVEEEKVKVPDIIIVPASEDENYDQCDDDVDDGDDDDDYDHDPSVELALTPKESPTDSIKSDQEYSESPPHGWLASNMIETIEEVRSKLKYGVERKMETVRTHTKAIKDSSAKKMESVRCHVKTIKDTGEKKIESIRNTGTVYMQSIKDTSSHAAHKVRAGVVMSVETMKYTVQSMKELCGTGEMGGQTISMVSMETDIDSHQSTPVYKSVTYV